MKTSDEGQDDRTLLREALERAARDPEPDMSRLMGAVPAILAEARRRRAQPQESPWIAVVPLASRAIPRIAAAAMILVLASAVVLIRDTAVRGRERLDLDSVLLVGDDAAGVEDLLLGDEPAQENGHG